MNRYMRSERYGGQISNYERAFCGERQLKSKNAKVKKEIWPFCFLRYGTSRGVEVGGFASVMLAGEWHLFV